MHLTESGNGMFNRLMVDIIYVYLLLGHSLVTGLFLQAFNFHWKTWQSETT